MVGPAALQGLGSNVWTQVAILLASAFYGISGVYGSSLLTRPDSESYWQTPRRN